MIIFILVAIVIALIPILLIRWIFAKRIEVNYTKEKIYGHYNGEILYSVYFSRHQSADEINNLKQKVETELNKIIEVYKKVK